ncbi:MAG: DUF4412 domain-containing protein [Prolixibacteraceae bacterium]|nr:DUF4412 domain-containing protein [Prolixibacteraceae bacterium]
MKKKSLKFSLTIVVLLVLFETSFAQNILRSIRDRAQDKIEDRIENRVEKEADKAIDEQLDKAEESIFGNDSARIPSADENNQRMANMLQGLGINGEPVPHNEQYNFNKLVQMHFESFDAKGEKTSTGEFITHLNDQSKHVAYEFVSGDMAEQSQGIFIIDAENNATIILSEEDGEKNAIIYGFGAMFSNANPEDLGDIDLSETPETYLANPNVSKTGRTKTIAGYKCSEYTYKDEETDATYWITEDMKMNTQDFFSALFKTNMYSHGMGWGYMMEGTSVDLETGEKSIMEVTNIDTNSKKSFNLTEYKVTNIGNFTAPVEE